MQQLVWMGSVIATIYRAATFAGYGKFFAIKPHRAPAGDPLQTLAGVLFRNWAFALPLVFVAQQGLMLLHLGFDFAECFFAGRQNIFSLACGVQDSIRQRKCQNAGLFVAAPHNGENTFQLNQVRHLAFQQFVQLVQPVGHFQSDRLL